jgi:hypothetical protein
MMAHRSTVWGSNGKRKNVEPQQEKSRQVQRLNVQDLVQKWPFDRVALNDSNAELQRRRHSQPLSSRPANSRSWRFHELTAQLLQKLLKTFERSAHALRIFKNSGYGCVPLLLLAYNAVAVS